MKKAITIIAAVLIALTAAGCSSNTPASTTASSNTTEKQAETSATRTDVVPETTTTTKQEDVKTEFKMGETWTVEGQWSLTVDAVEEMTDRNPYSDKTPAAVYLITYTYKNIGYEKEYFDGLFISLEEGIIDKEGFMGYSYPNDKVYFAQETPVGAACKAQACVAVDNAGLPFKINIVRYDGNDQEQKATFIIGE